MRIIFVRHGHPDYKNDCLTELGHRQAAAVAERLAHENIDHIFSSTCGRALETAEYTAKMLGISEIVHCEFMREIRWKSIDESEIYMKGHPWYTADNMVSNNQSLLDQDWMIKEPFCKNIVTDFVRETAKQFDELLTTFGYYREGDYYRVGTNTDKTLAIFSHAGSSSAVLGHMLNLPFPFMCGVMPPELTAVTILNLAKEENFLITPKIELCNDSKHIVDIDFEEKTK